jgi:2-polyprenyl-3-methyl-5-hydroxy-6-metoxy-1,4-benzoquinol methylase
VPSCPQCGADTRRLLRALDYNRRTDDTTFSYYRCPSCRLTFLWPLPIDMGLFYANEYYGIPASAEMAGAGAEPERYKIDLVRQYVDSGRLLEIGPAWGGFALLARDAGFAVEAIERDASCCDFLREVVRVGVHEGDDPAAILTLLPMYDVIALWQVIEHLDDPWSVLGEAVEHVKPGGVLVIATPNPDAFQFRLLRRRWTHLDAPRHTQLIPIGLLRSWGARHALRTLLATTRDPGSLGWNAFGWRESLAGLVTRRFLKMQARHLGTVLSHLFEPIDEREGLGTCYTIVLQKEPD